MAEEKERLDILITQRQLAESREKAKAYIMAGVVYVNGQREDKPGVKVKVSDSIEVREKMKYVSRGGYKLEKAMEVFPIDLKEKVCMDVGASTGGFSDCMLQNGASKVYAIDVGYGQLAWKLRQDERIICMEKTNMRYVDREQVAEEIAFASIDVAFISLTKILQPVYNLLKEQGEVVALIKPQFEAGREQVQKHGVVKDPLVHEQVIHHVWGYANEIGLAVKGLDFSPIKGPEGNIEYLLHLVKEDRDEIESDEKDMLIKRVVLDSHQNL
jgi:23S rRNA (cytidine1920-2'-O)/16S rRNA (cytidine1409-2'-O)-methyltransferase